MGSDNAIGRTLLGKIVHVGLQKRLATAKKKLDEAKGSGKPIQAFEDKIYEIEDELRLAGQT